MLLQLVQSTVSEDLQKIIVTLYTQASLIMRAVLTVPTLALGQPQENEPRVTGIYFN